MASSPSSATLKVKVPAAAIVFVNGKPTKSTGENRHYVSLDLTPGLKYSYEVRVELPGAQQNETQTVQLVAGDTRQLTFELAKAASAPSSPVALTKN